MLYRFRQTVVAAKLPTTELEMLQGIVYSSMTFDLTYHVFVTVCLFQLNYFVEQNIIFVFRHLVYNQDFVLVCFICCISFILFESVYFLDDLYIYVVFSDFYSCFRCCVLYCLNVLQRGICHYLSWIWIYVLQILHKTNVQSVP